MSRLLQNEINLITYKFGGSHKGIDLIPKDYSLCNILAHSDGVVVDCRNDYTKCDEKTGVSYGNFVELDHGNGYRTVYAHMKAGTVTVKVGDTVKKGTVLGAMWNSGRSNGIHLHFEVKKDGVKIDPFPFLEADFFKSIADKKYTLIKDVNVYMSADEADKHINPVTVYKKGEYYVFYEALGMVNITKTKGVAGGWMNPSDNRKTVEEVATEICDGVGGWGNYPERTERLKEHGYDPEEVQALVNKIMEEREKAYHVVQDGDTLKSIAKQYNTTVEALVELNILITKGQKIRVK